MDENVMNAMGSAGDDALLNATVAPSDAVPQETDLSENVGGEMAATDVDLSEDFDKSDEEMDAELAAASGIETAVAPAGETRPATTGKSAKLRRQDKSYAEQVVERDAANTRLNQQRLDDARAVEWSKILNAQRTQTIIRNCTIVGAEVLEQRGADGTITGQIPVARCMILGFPAYIPLGELWVNLPAQIQRVLNENDGNTFLRRAMAYINNMTGNDKIPLVITAAQYSPDKERRFVVLASRRMALLRDINSFYARPDAPAKDKKRKVNTTVGETVTGTVVSVSGRMICVNVRGVDVILPFQYLTNRYVDDTTKSFAPGNEVLVEINDISWPEGPEYFAQPYSEETMNALRHRLSAADPGSYEARQLASQIGSNVTYRMPKISINGRMAEAKMMYARNGKEVRAGGRYRAIVNYRYTRKEDGVPVIFLWLPDFDLPGLCYQVNMGNTHVVPNEGSIVEVRVSDGNSKPYIHCTITRMLSDTSDVPKLML